MSPAAQFAARGLLAIVTAAGALTAAAVAGFLIGGAAEEALEIQLDEDHAGHTAAPVT